MAKQRRVTTLLILAISAVMAFPAPALANVGVSGSLSITGNNVTVDAPGHFATVSVTNTNTTPQQADSNTFTELSVAPSCAADPTVANVCSVPDVGAIATATTATGEPGTACAGRTFNVSGPDGSGVYSFTVVGSPVVLAPPGGAPGSGTCSVTFPLYFRRVPTTDVSGSTGTQTNLNARARLTHNQSTTVVTSVLNVQITVNAPVGGNGVADFNGDGSSDISVYRAGAWHVYNQTTVFWGLAGDIPVPADYDGNGTTDRVVYRDGGWYNHTKDTNFFGLAGDIPVPADYTGDGKVDRAVYRAGTWYIEGRDPVPFGIASDIPVPGNYDADPAIEIAVFRAGAWYVEGQAPVYLGVQGDIPVPADYNGDGDLERAVYRPGTGTWFREGMSTVTWGGVAGDVPVPADYNNDNFADIGLFRAGAWYIVGFTPVFHGVAGDIPLPLPQAVYRKFF